MRLVSMIAILCLAPVVTAQQQASPAEDLCVAPPSSYPPSLPAKLLPGQGRSHLPITTRNPKSQEFFNQGLAQMHSFAGYEAERSFLQAAQLDPEAPMPQWGVAMVAAGDYRPGFQLRGDESGSSRPAQPRRPSPGLERARAASGTAQKLSVSATPLEKAYIAAIAARRDPAAKDPSGDYIRALRSLIQEFPQEAEAKSFLALALMSGYTPGDRNSRPGTDEAAAILKEVLKQDPDHVGAHHYVIHALEGSTHPQDAWLSSKRYPEMAPEVPHALHMPGHIYVQSDRWADAAAAFEAAARKEREYLAADQLYPNGHHGHNVHFLASTYCFLGRFDEALAGSAELMGIRENPREVKEPANSRTPYRQGWFARLRTLVHFRKWEQVLDASTLVEYPGPRERAWRHWARGLAYAARGEEAQARREAEQMEEQMKAWQKVAGSESPQLRTARLELDGHLELADGRTSKGLDTLEQAARMEILLPYNEPPAYPRPVWEAMGQAALDTREWARAESAFRRALEQNPGSTRAKDGLASALARSAPTVAGQ